MTSSSAGSHAPPQLLHTPTSTSSSTSGSRSPRGRSSSAGGGNGGGTTNQACAACKYQRRKCNPDCPLAPYFPADQQRRFLHAHRLFGVSNILKTLRGLLRPDLCADAMGSLVFQAEMRARDPVGGCYRLILTLERQLEAERAELAAVLHHLALCRHHHQAAATTTPPADHVDVIDTSASCNQKINQQRTILINDAADDQEVALYADEQQQQQQLFDYLYYDDTSTAASSGKPVTLDINVDAVHQFDYDDDDQKVHDDEPPAIAQQHQHLDVNCHSEHKDYYEMKPDLLVDVFDMRLPVDANDDDDKAEAVSARVDLNQELQENDTMGYIATGEAPQMALESSQCRLGLAFSAL